MMELSHDGPVLPQVTAEDLLSIMYEDITEPTHRARFNRFAESHPVLCQELIRRSLVEASHVQIDDDHHQRNTLEVQKPIIDTVSFAIDALHVAQERTTSGASDDEAPPRLIEPGDDRRAQ